MTNARKNLNLSREDSRNNYIIRDRKLSNPSTAHFARILGRIGVLTVNFKNSFVYANTLAHIHTHKANKGSSKSCIQNSNKHLRKSFLRGRKLNKCENSDIGKQLKKPSSSGLDACSKFLKYCSVTSVYCFAPRVLLLYTRDSILKLLYYVTAMVNR